MLLNPETAQQCDSFRASLPHALLLTGVKGIGLGSVAKELASSSLAAWYQPRNKKGDEDKSGSIYIADIRTLYEQRKTGTNHRQVAVIDDADRMTRGAQNAFLKLLEEPTKGSHFILTSHAPEHLLPTVRSRVQTMTVLPLTDEQTQQFLRDLALDPTKKAQIDFIAHGRPAEMQRLASDETYFNIQAELAREARTFLTGNKYQQIVVAQQYKNDRAGALALIEMTSNLAQRSLISHPQTALIARLKKLLKAHESISANGNPRLHLMSTVV